jgi:hypothetical protein
MTNSSQIHNLKACVNSCNTTKYGIKDLILPMRAPSAPGGLTDTSNIAIASGRSSLLGNNLANSSPPDLVHRGTESNEYGTSNKSIDIFA